MVHSTGFQLAAQDIPIAVISSSVGHIDRSVYYHMVTRMTIVDSHASLLLRAISNLHNVNETLREHVSYAVRLIYMLFEDNEYRMVYRSAVKLYSSSIRDI